MNKGFSFIELVIAVGIVIIITGGAILYFPRLVNESEARALEANLNTLRKVIDDYYSDFGQYPATLSTLTQPTPGGYIYIRKVPIDPTTDVPDWEVSEDNITFYEINDTASYSYVAYVRSNNPKYSEF